MSWETGLSILNLVMGVCLILVGILELRVARKAESAKAKRRMFITGTAQLIIGAWFIILIAIAKQ